MSERKGVNELEEDYLKKGWQKLILIKKPKKFTFEMFKYVHDNYGFKSDDELSNEMFDLFNIKIDRNTIKVYRNYLGLNKNKRGQILYKRGLEQGITQGKLLQKSEDFCPSKSHDFEVMAEKLKEVLRIIDSEIITKDEVDKEYDIYLDRNVGEKWINEDGIKKIKQEISKLINSQTKQGITTLRKNQSAESSSEPKCPLDKPDCNTQDKKGCGKKMDALGYIICGEFDDLKHGGKQWLCPKCLDNDKKQNGDKK